MNYQKLLRSQSLMVAAGSVIFPFYLLFIRKIGDSYSQFGWAYGLFTLIAACSYPIIGRMTDRFGERQLLLLYSWGMSLIMLVIPITTEIWMIYFIQIVMGFLGAVQKTAEKTALSRHVQDSPNNIGKSMGHYHLWTSVWSAVAIIVTGYLIDFLTIGSLFYLASLMFAYAGVILLVKKNKEPMIP
ncbi:MFS transporter [Bacillus sp. CGMCC 1.16607]|uniref:MFS transporter n=1 Tax=Bacillus sp. CGMCC 1.16607 TaxID=3351842 RepID=UPI003644DDBF